MALIKNVSAEGLCFIFEEKMDQDTLLNIELVLPGDKDAICMIGEVRWCQDILGGKNGKPKYDIGVRLLSVNDKPVEESIYFDEAYHLEWSVVLDSIFGNYRILTQKRKNFFRPS